MFKQIVKKCVYGACSPFAHKRIAMDIEHARKILGEFSPRPTGRGITAKKRSWGTPTHDLDIIVPAYNVEAYLRECIESILGQETKFSYQVVLIDDGSTDATGTIADEYAGNSCVRVIHQSNRGFSGARNRGMETVSGKYLMFVDSDDKLAPGAIEVLMDTAIQEGTMIVEGGFYRLTGEKLSIGYKHDKTETVIARNNLKGYPCGKVFKSDIFKNLQYPEGFWFEDTLMSFLVYPQAGMATRIPECVYIYRNNPNSISHTAGKNPKCIDTYWITEEMMAEYKELELPVDKSYYEKIACQVILNQKRIRRMPKEIRQNVFVLTKTLIEQYLKGYAVPKEYTQLFESIQENDFGIFELYCLTH